MTDQTAAENTDRELWRETPDDYYAASIHVTKEGGIGINVGGLVFVMDIHDWHNLAVKDCDRGLSKLRNVGERSAVDAVEQEADGKHNATSN